MIGFLRTKYNLFFINKIMAIKTFCDKCGIEIKKGDEVASIVSIEKQYTLKDTQGQAMSITRLACGKCFEPIKKIFEDAKN